MLAVKSTMQRRKNARKLAGMVLLPPAEAARRARSAIAYSGLEHHEIAAKTGLDVSKIRRIASRTKPRGASLEELWEIADACGVPRSFMEEGFSEAASADERVEELERDLGAVAVLLPLLLKAAGIQLPPRGVQALERVQRKRA
jgi:transcriptional regulator with XRE-family HTH domain